MSDDFKDKLRSINFGAPPKDIEIVKGGNKVIGKRDEEDGAVRLMETHKPDGRVAVHVQTKAPDLGTEL